MLAFLATSAYSQTFGEISGTVHDQSGAVIAGATVTATNTGTNATRSTVTNDAGVYSFPALQPGSYNVKVEKSGFKSFTQTGVQLQVQQSARLDIELSLGQVSESVEVSAQGALLASENATVGTVIDTKQITEIPLNGRNYLNLVALAPNVSFGFPAAGQAGSRQGGVRSDMSISVGGQRAQYNRFTLDGVENTDPNFNTFVVLPSVDALQEFKVQSGVYPAEFGRGATQINVSTKPGTNAYHGTLFEFLRNDKLDAKNYAFTTARPAKDPFRWNQFGFTLGGPVQIPKLFHGRNKAFFMTNYEWFRQRRQVQAVSTLPSAAMQGGDFSSLSMLIFDPKTRVNTGGSVTAQPFGGNLIPANRIHSVSKKLLEFYPTPNIPGPLASNFQQAQGRPIERDQFIGRFDFIESANSQWVGRYSWGDENQTSEALKLNGTKVITNFKQVMASNTRVIRPTIVNETRFGYTSFYNTTGPELAFTRNVVGELGIPGLNPGPPVQWGIPNIALAGVYSGFGNDSEGPYENTNSSYQFINNTTIVHGKHTLKFGGEVRQDHYNQIGNQFARAQFTFNRNGTLNPAAAANTTGDPFADFLLGETQQSEAAVSIATAQFRSTSLAFYLDDNWKVGKNISINIGLRYELTPPWEDQTGRLFNGIIRQDLRAVQVADRSLYPFFMRQGAASNDPYNGVVIRWPDIEVRQDGTLGNRLVGTDKNDFAPRFGLSWSPTSKWVIRTGAGYFYSQDSGNPRFDMSRNLAGRLRFNSNTAIPNMTFDNSLSSITGSVANVPNPYTFANPYDRRTPITAQFMLNIQREIAHDTVVEIGYLASVSHHLEALRAVNESLPACAARNSRPGCENDPLAGVAVLLRAPFPNFGRIQLVDNGGNGHYSGLSTKITKRYNAGLSYLVGYTLAKSIDTATAIRNQGGDTLFPQNSYCRSCERARSSHDTRHRLVASLQYDLPFGKGRHFGINNRGLDAAAGGWRLVPSLTLQSGFPVTITNGVENSHNGAGSDRPSSTGVNAELSRSEQDPFRFFNTQAFVQNLDGTFGNVGRNTLNSPGIIGWDFAVLKDFNLFRDADNPHKLQFRFEGFNFPNHPIWANPNANISSSTFGRITSTRISMRTLQLALKYQF